MIKKIATGLCAVSLVFAASACEASGDNSDQYSGVEAKAKKAKAYIPKNTVELDNYNKAQELYDSPEAIIWCTSSWSNPSAPLFTVPIAGKLTSSSVSFFANKTIKKYGSNGSPAEVENRSIDGLYHGNPGPYRYGFTPGGQYVDFTNMDVFCTTALTKFQREQTQVSITTDDKADSAQVKAQKALKNGDSKAAEKALEGVESVDSK